jgi:hypothetical protein
MVGCHRETRRIRCNDRLSQKTRRSSATMHTRCASGNRRLVHWRFSLDQSKKSPRPSPHTNHRVRFQVNGMVPVFGYRESSWVVVEGIIEPFHRLGTYAFNDFKVPGADTFRNICLGLPSGLKWVIEPVGGIIPFPHAQFRQKVL